MMTHELKTDPDLFSAVWCGIKTYDIRFNDRGFMVGDDLLLRETRYTSEQMKAGSPLEYTGREKEKTISHILSGPVLGLQDGWVIFSFASGFSLIEMQYIGAVALLGRIVRSFHYNEEDLALVEMAMQDLVKTLPGRFEVVKTTGGWSLEPSRVKGGE